MNHPNHHQLSAHSRLAQADQRNHDLENRLRSLMIEEIHWLVQAIRIFEGSRDEQR